MPVLMLFATIQVALAALFSNLLASPARRVSSSPARGPRVLEDARPCLALGIGHRKARWLVLPLITMLLAAAPAVAGTQTATTTTLAVTSSGGAVTAATAGNVVTLTATVTAGSTPATLGQVSFCDAAATYCTDIHLLAKAQLTKAGTASYSFRPGIGSHSYKAVFAGTADNAGSTSGAEPLTVTGLYPTITAIARSGSTGNYTLTATVGGNGSAAPSGTVSFLETSNSNAVLGAATLGTGTEGLTFQSTSILTGRANSSNAIALGDFNGDGIADYAVVDYCVTVGYVSDRCSIGSVSVFLGNKDGTFTSVAASPAAGFGTSSIAVGDFNGDGILDLAVVNSYGDEENENAPGTVTILLGKRDGTFTPTATSPETGYFPWSVAVSDFNGDGIPDLAVTNIHGATVSGSYGGTVTVLLGNGDGTFTAATSSPATGRDPESIAADDFNGDGIPDLAVANADSNTVTILLGNGDGTFTAATSSPATGKTPKSIAVGDFNKDGISDLAVVNYCSLNASARCTNAGSVTILLGNNDGTFSSTANSPATGFESESIAVGDFNEDGIPDLAVVNNCGNDSVCSSGTVTVLLGTGDGNFTPTTTSTGYGSFSIATGDFNGDGTPDFLVAGGTVSLSVKQTATAQATSITVPVATGSHAVVASYAGDSSYAASTSISTLLASAQGTPAVSVAASANPAVYGVSVTLTATVTGIGNLPYGSVVFYDNSQRLGASALSSGQATCSSAKLSAGSHSITVAYSGDVNYTESTSPAYSLTVSKVTPAISLISSANPVPQGTAVTFTATLAGANTTPSGTVTFYDGTTQLGTNTVNSSGVATYTSSALAVGSHSITASYGGNAIYAVLTSAAVVETVLPATTTTLAITSAGSAVSTVASGSVVTLTATVASGGAAVTAGTVNFCDATATYCSDIHQLGTAQLTSAGTATIRLIAGIGSHSYKAKFAGTASVGTSASAASSLAVTGVYPTATSIAQSGSMGNYTLTATVGGSGPLAPTGTVSFLDASNGNAVLSTAALSGGASALNFVTASNPSDGDGAASIALGDFNGDGLLDQAVANFNANTISVFLGDGTGNFTQTTSSPATGDNPIAVVAGDFNGDGKLDLAVANYGGDSVTILLGNGNGNFTATSSSPASGSHPDALAVGDFNGDGNLDLAVTNYADGTVTVLLGDGKSNFTATSATAATGLKPESIATGDFNDDGKADLAVANACGSDATCQSAGTVTVLLGKGDGSFTAASASPATDIDPYSIAVGDFNGDGKADLAVANFKGEDVTVLLGKGDGSFTAKASPATGNGPISVAIGDFNGDGKADLATANYDDDTLTVLLGDGKGGFTAMSATPQTGQYPLALAVGDFNGDSRPDLAVANFYDSILSVLVATPSQAATAVATGVAPSGTGVHQVAASYAGSASYASSSSATTGLTGQLGTATTLALTSAGSPVTTVAWGSSVTLTATVTADSAAVTAGTVNFCDATATHCTDIHQIGTAQLTSAGTASISLRPAVGAHSYKAVFAGTTAGSAPNASSSSSIATLTVTGTLPSITALAASGTVGNYTLTASVAGAGTAAPTGTVSFLDTSNSNAVLATAQLGAGTSAVSLLNPANPATGYSPITTVAGDFNEDGVLDLAVVNTCASSATCSTVGSVSILLGNGDGTFTPKAERPATGKTPRAIALGDFNKDGFLDLAVVNIDSRTVTILLGKGDGTFTQTATSPATGTYPMGIAVGDFNGDGNLDLAVSNYQSNTISIFPGSGDGSFTATNSTLATGSYPAAIAVGDYNGDGIPDMAVTNAGNNTVTIFLGKGDGTFSPMATHPATDRYPFGITASDFNKDGILDLAVANIYANTVTVLLGKGDGTFKAMPVRPATGIYPRYIAVGDFNGDTIPDMAVTNQCGKSTSCSNGSTSVFLGKGDGTFTSAAASTVVTGKYSWGIAAGDFTGDGFAGFAVPNNSNQSVSVFLPETHAATAKVTGIAPVGTGTHLVAASYGGDTNYNSSSSGTVSLTAKLLPPGMTMSASSYSSSTGTPVTFTAKVIGSTVTPKSTPGKAAAPMTTKPAPTGTTTFYVGTTVLGSTTLNSSGQAVFTTGKLPTGTDSVTAHYSGDSHYAATTSSAVTVKVAYKPQPAIKITPSASAVNYGSPVTLTATLTGSGSTKPTGSVAFLNSATQLGTATVNTSGVATFKTSLLPGGKDSITVSYLGDTNYGQFTSAATVVTINRVAPTVKLASSATSALAGTTLTLTATLSKTGAAPTGTVTFHNGAVSLGSGTVSSSGVATLSTGAIPVGRNSITATYAGDTNYAAGTSAAVTVSITPKAVTTAKLATSAGTAAYGVSVTLTATLSASGATPTGTVSFLDGTVALGAGTLSSSGVARLATTKLTGGKNSITAAYVGDTKHAAAISAAVSVTVNKAAPTVKLTSSIASIAYGGSVKLTATLAGIGAKPTGTVTFLNGSQTLGTGTLNSSGVATLVTKKLAAGKDSVTASYAGNLNYSAAASSAVSVSVSKALLTVTATNRTKTYGAALPTLTYAFSGFVNGETAATATKGAVSLATTATAKSKTGSYPITVALGTLSAANYTFKLAPATLIVTKAVLTAASTSVSVAYNQALPTLTYALTGFVNGDSASTIKGDPLETTTAKKGSKAGSYTIKIAQGTLTPSANYSLAFKNGTLTIQ